MREASRPNPSDAAGTNDLARRAAPLRDATPIVRNQAERVYELLRSPATRRADTTRPTVPLSDSVSSPTSVDLNPSPSTPSVLVSNEINQVTEVAPIEPSSEPQNLRSTGVRRTEQSDSVAIPRIADSEPTVPERKVARRPVVTPTVVPERPVPLRTETSAQPSVSQPRAGISGTDSASVSPSPKDKAKDVRSTGNKASGTPVSERRVTIHARVDSPTEDHGHVEERGERETTAQRDLVLAARSDDPRRPVTQRIAERERRQKEREERDAREHPMELPGLRRVSAREKVIQEKIAAALDLENPDTVKESLGLSTRAFPLHDRSPEITTIRDFPETGSATISPTDTAHIITGMVSVVRIGRHAADAMHQMWITTTPSDQSQRPNYVLLRNVDLSTTEAVAAIIHLQGRHVAVVGRLGLASRRDRERYIADITDDIFMKAPPPPPEPPFPDLSGFPRWGDPGEY